MTTLTAPRRRKLRRACQYVIGGERCGKPAVVMHVDDCSLRCAAHSHAEACCWAMSETRSAA